MKLEAIRRRRVPLGLGFLLLAVWLLCGLRRIDPDAGLAVLDSPLGLVSPRVVAAGWHLAPPGVLRLTRYPSLPDTLSFQSGETDGSALVTREGIEVSTSGIIRFRVDPNRLLDVHKAIGPEFRRGLDRWIQDALRTAIASSDYSGISGARTEDLRSALGQSLAERFRTAGLELLSCDVAGVRIRSAALAQETPRRQTTGSKVILIGLDGADWNIIDPLIQAGRLPNLARLAHRGSRGRLHSITPMLSPVVWTSIATGVLPSRHGIVDFLASTGRDGDKQPVTSTLRKTKALWNILSEQGLSVGVAGWWASFPAEKVSGFVVSDRVAYQLFGSGASHNPARAGKVYPPEIADLVASLTVAPETLGVTEVSRYVRLPDDRSSLPADQNRLIDDLKTLLAAGDTYTAVSLALRERYHPDFQAVYIEGTDTIAHLFMRFAPPPMEGVTKEDAQRFGRAVDEYYRHADELVGRLVEAAGPQSAVIVCSDHGFRTGDNRPLTDSRIGYGQAADWHRKYGIVVLAGPPFRSDHELSEASVLDITPTVLALLGLPVAEDMDGRPILDAFEPSFLASHPVRYVPTYESSSVAASSGRPAPSDPQGDQELRERLESLGYLSQDSANSHNNRGMLLLSQGDYDSAIAEFEQAIRSSEDLPMARLNIARALYKKRDFPGATKVLNEYLSREPRSKEAENLLGNIAMEKKEYAEAEKRFETALGYEPNFTDARNSLGILYNKMGRTDDALREFLRVVAVDPDYAEALNNIGVIYKEQGRAQDAAASFRKAIAADPEFAGSYSNLALVLEQQGDLKGAEEMFRNALQRDPDNVQVRTNYGALLYTMERFDQARLELEKAIGIDPSDASAYNNLGAVYGRLGRPADEVAAYRKAVELDPEYADVHHNLGLALIKQRKVEEGEREMKRAIQIDPSYSPAYLNLARSFLGRGRTAEAVDLLSRGTERVPGDADMQALLGEACLSLGQKDRAMAAFEASLALKPDQEAVRRRIKSLAGVAKPGGAADPPSSGKP
jgi:Tfp pilus assembly protein PilF/predicted AlkP superfamily phosphohydrolase/phosphomutase